MAEAQPHEPSNCDVLSVPLEFGIVDHRLISSIRTAIYLVNEKSVKPMRKGKYPR